MNTLFTVTHSKDKPEEKAFSIDLGIDALEGKTDAEIRQMAEQSIKIKIQGPLRKLKEVSIETIEANLHKHYPDAVVSEGIVKPPSDNATLKKILSYGLSANQVLELVEEQTS